MRRVFIIYAAQEALSYRNALAAQMVSYRFTAADGTKVVFREPRRGDAPQFMKLINDIVDEPSSGIMMDRHSSPEDERKWVRARMEGIRRRRLVMLTAVADGTIKGNCDIVMGGWKKAHRGVLGIVLAKDLRGKGVGEALMRRTIELAERRLKGLEFVDLSVLDYNRRAMSLYAKVGFIEIARIPKGIKEGRRYYDELLMTRPVKKKR
jgi:ribosomal protein S18 acetylase RimI-like enzyme